MRHPKNYWKNEKNILEESKKYKSRTEFKKKSNRAYDAARKLNLLDKMEWLSYKNVFKDKVDFIYKYHFINENAIYIGRTIYPEIRDNQHKTKTNDSVYKFALEHNTPIPPMEIIESGLTVYQGVNREIYWESYYNNNGFEMINKTKCGSIGSMSKGKWTKNKCIEESKKYKSRGEFYINSNSAYQKSLKNGWINEMTWLSNNKKHPKGYWKIKENVINESKKYTSKNEFQKGNLSAFLAAHRYGYIDEMTWLVKQKQHKKGYWTYENIEKEAVKYETKTDFQKNCNVAYRKALQLKIIDDFFTNDYIQY